MALATSENTDAAIAACRARIAALEQALWANADPPPPAGEGNAVSPRACHFDESQLEAYHAAFQQLERLLAVKGDDPRHKFVIVIPVADRPQHLKDCLDSLLHLCRSFGYGGFSAGRYRKVAVIVADDSRAPGNIARNREIARECAAQGIETEYFGLEEQLAQRDKLSAADQRALAGMLGTIERSAFYHKGPSIMRNLVYLKLNEMRGGTDKLLFYFIDSDQEFQVKIGTPHGDQNRYAVNFLYYLDQIFSRTEATILTGKVVGDPPVSPAVMAGNFLDDVIAFVRQMAATTPNAACRFHGARPRSDDDACYHDMAALFGFQQAPEAYRYQCGIAGEHDNAGCFNHFASKLSRFFYGEHPTRKTYYNHEDALASVRPARTVYTGNYLFKPEGLKYFIPFAPLKLRMAGPVLGRLIKAELQGRFVSANLPMLHKRTVRDTGQAEFRPGIAAEAGAIDLCGEFERQFYGDVMLFTIEKLCAQGYPGQTPAAGQIAAALQSTHASLLRQYNDKGVAIREKLAVLKALLAAPESWWKPDARHTEAAALFQAFIANIEHNFGAHAAGYALLDCPANTAKRHAGILDAIARHAADGTAWDAALADLRAGAAA